MHSKAIPAYARTVILGWCINTGLFYFLILIAHADHRLAQVCTTAVVAAMNFVLYKRIVFRERITRKLAP
ncbi:GtrA family protein [Paracandidimonas lactea]|uniref:GtrA family protein n=1 Tax=Paracandidimonas lactea TaxID=2895524 RepID=UPI0034E19EAB